MAVNRLHAMLFEAVARDLDRQVRAQFVEESLRPQYLKDFQRDLHAMIRFSEGGVEIGGRFVWLKRLVNRLIRPFWYHQTRMNRMTIDRLSELQEDLTKLVAASEEMHAVVREDLERRFEQFRAETTDEVHRLLAARALPERSRSAAFGTGQPVPSGARLVLGPLAVRRPGYVHIDAEAGPLVDAVAPLDRLPVAPGSVSEIVVANALETFPAAEVRERLLPYWTSLLEPGGRLVLVADDFGAVADRFRNGEIDFVDFAGLLFGAGAPGKVRRSAYSPELLRTLAEGAGLQGVDVTERRQDPNVAAYGFELVAYRPRA